MGTSRAVRPAAVAAATKALVLSGNSRPSGGVGRRIQHVFSEIVVGIDGRARDFSGPRCLGKNLPWNSEMDIEIVEGTPTYAAALNNINTLERLVF